MKPKATFAIGIALALAMLAAAGLLSYRRVTDQNENQKWVLHTHLTIERLDAIENDFLAANLSLRSHLLVPRPAFLHAYSQARSRFQTDSGDLRRLVSDNPRQIRSLARLDALAAAWFAGLARVNRLRADSGLPAALAALHSLPAHPSLDEIRAAIDGMKLVERGLLKRRLAVAHAGLRRTSAFVLAGYLLALLFLLSAALLGRREQRQRDMAERKLRHSEESLHLLVTRLKDYAIYVLDADGRVASWNVGAERLKGYSDDEILGRHFSCFYTPEDLERAKPEALLQTALREGSAEDEGWRVRKDGSRFWAAITITLLRDPAGKLRGFGKVVRDMTERRRAERETRLRNAQLEAANKELEAFCYSVSHDLRAPLRGIHGFSQALLEDCAPQLDSRGHDYLRHVLAATERMGLLIDDLLSLSRVTRTEMRRQPLDLTHIAHDVAGDLTRSQPGRNVQFAIAPGLHADGDPQLIRQVLENLLGNAWKFTSRRPDARIEFDKSSENGAPAFFVRDNGAGFDPSYAHRLFGPFQRLHAMNEFPGNGVGLATVQRILLRHGGAVWGTGAVGRGATFYFTL